MGPARLGGDGQLEPEDGASGRLGAEAGLPAVPLREPADGRQPISGAECAAIDRLAQLVGQVLVQESPSGRSPDQVRAKVPMRHRPKSTSSG